MAQPRQLAPEEDPERAMESAREAVAAFREYLATGERQRMDEFTRIFNSDLSERFLRSFQQEFNRQMAGTPFAPIIMAYLSSMHDFEPAEFVRLAAAAYESAPAFGRPAEFRAELERRMRSNLGAAFREEMLSEAMMARVIEPLVAIERQRRQEASALDREAREAAALFVGALRSTGADDRTARIASLREAIERNSHAEAGGRAFNEGFFEAFSRELRSQCGECTEIISAFTREHEEETPGPASMGRLLDQLPALLTQLRAPGFDRAALDRVYGRNFVEAVASFVTMASVPVLEFSAAGLRRRLDGIREYARELRLTGLEDLFSDWERRLEGEPTREELIALNNEIPTREMLESTHALASRTARSLTEAVDGGSDFYVTLGSRVWQPRIETLLGRMRVMRDDRVTGPFATAMMARYRVNMQHTEQLAAAVGMANQDIPAGIATLEELMRSGNLDDVQGRLDAIGQLFGVRGQINRDIDTVTDRIALFYTGVARERDGRIEIVDRERWQQIRSVVARRLMSQFSVPAEGDPVARMRQRYEAMARDRDFITFRNTFTEAIDRLVGQLDASPPVTEADRYTYNSRRALAQSARDAFQAMPLDAAFGVYELLRATYGDGWSRSLDNPDSASRVCAILANLSGIPPAYAADMLGRIGQTLLRNYDDASIAAIVTAVSSYSQPYVQGDFFHLLAEYYATLPDKIMRLFPDITAVQHDRREPTYDVRVRTPAEDPDFADLFLPAANIWVRVPKRIYEEWRTEGFLNIASAPDITRIPATAPDFLRVMSTFIERPMVEGRVNLPVPFIRLPILLQNIGVLAPDSLPPVGELISMGIEGEGGFRYMRSNELDSYGVSTTMGQTFIREGAVSTGTESYELTEDTAGEQTHRGRVDIQNVRLTEGYHVNTFDAEVDVIGDRMETLAALFSGMAPQGADTLTYFRRTEDSDGRELYEGHVFQRLANGSFVLADTVTLPPEVANELYAEAFNGPMQRMYGGVRVQTGGTIAQLDGALLFSGPRTSEEEELPEDATAFQGIGGALQVGEWGGYADYEHTRSTRGAGAFGRFMPEEREFWIGRLTADRLVTDESGMRTWFAEGSWVQADRTEVRAFIGLPEHMGAQWENTQGAVLFSHMLSRDFLGWRHIGAGGGRLLRDFTSGADEELAGGRFFGVSRDMVNGLVVSALYRRYRAAPLTEDLAEDEEWADVPPISEEAGVSSRIDEELAQAHPELEEQPEEAESARQMIISAGIRQAIGRQFLLETGGGWDIYNSEGGAFLNFDWVPVGETVSDLGLRAFLVMPATGEQRVYVPIVGMYGEFIAGEGVRLITEGHYVAYYESDSERTEHGGIGEVRVRHARVELALGGGYIPEVTYGGHAGLRIPITRRLTLGIAASASEDTRAEEEALRTLRQVEGIAGAVFTMPHSDSPGFQLGNIFGSVSGMYQVQDVVDDEEGSGFQLDVVGGANWVDSDTNLTARIGVQYWQAEWPEISASRVAGTAGVAYRSRSWRLRGERFVFNPTVSVDAAAGMLTLDSGETSSSEIDIQLNFSIGGEF